MATRLPASTNIDKQALISGLQKYGGIKSIIQELTQQLDELRNQIDELQRQKKDLDEQNKNMLSILAYSRPVVEFLHRSDDDYSLSSDYNNVKILAMIAIILYMLYIRDEGIGKLLVGDVKELVPLLRVAVRGRAEE